MKKALITGITGQDGSYLAEFLVRQGYDVHGVAREEDGAISGVHVHKGDATDVLLLGRLIEDIGPHEIYHLASSLRGRADLDYDPELFRLNVECTDFLLSKSSKSKFLFAGSITMFENSGAAAYDEQTSIDPKSVYGVAKAAGYLLTRAFRSAGTQSCTAILANHESPRKSTDFLLRKITHAAAQVKLGLKGKVEFGDIHVKRDWGHARDFVEAMWLMLQQNELRDYVVATGTAHSATDALEVAFGHLDLDWKDHIITSTDLIRQDEKREIVVDSRRIKKDLQWHAKVSFSDMIKEMVEHDMNELSLEMRDSRVI